MSQNSLCPLIVCSWNVNGLRSFRPPLKPVLDELDASVICLQEVKTSSDLGREWACVEGYNAYFNHCASKAGYSGVAIYCREPLKPIRIIDNISKTFHFVHAEVPSTLVATEKFDSILSKIGLSAQDVKELDAEGRFLAAVFLPDSHQLLLHKNNLPNLPVIIISVYMPRINPDEPKRMLFRTQFEKLFSICIDTLFRQYHVVICGDFNVHHTALDVCEPEIVDADPSSLPSRQWMNALLAEEQRDPRLGDSSLRIGGPTFIDSFRYVNPRTKGSFTCWSTRTGARATNYGTRIDYILVDSRLVDGFDENLSLKVDHMTAMRGSDHCPVRAHIPLTLTASPSFPYPTSCSRFWPQCQSKQIKLKPFVVPTTPSTAKVSDTNNIAHFSESSNPIQKRRLKQATLVGLLSYGKHENRDIGNPDSVSSSPILDGLSEREAADLLQITFQADSERNSKTISAWQSLLRGPKKAPLCRGHREPCLLRTVKQSLTASGSRRGRRFWVCARPQGAKDNPTARCDTFLWDDQYRP